MIRAGYLLPEKPKNRDAANDRGFDVDSLAHDRVPVETDPELAAALSRQAQEIRRMRDEDRQW